MKWKRVKGTKLVKDKVDGQLKPIMAPNVTSTQHGGTGNSACATSGGGSGRLPGMHRQDSLDGSSCREDGDDMSDGLDDISDMAGIPSLA